MRGEHSLRGFGAIQADGSSPHARGAPYRVREPPRHGGIIPACAGSTILATPLTYAVRDHPRMRGEHAVATSELRLNRGSSPHARGARVPLVAVMVTVGIIPACAGSTSSLAESALLPRDHPRMRGEHNGRWRIPTELVGSSPHARGARRESLPPARRQGIIPACAGSTGCPA